MPVGSTRATLEHVASAGRVVVAVGTAVTTAGRTVPFAASSANGGASWAESALPVPPGLTSVTALVTAGRTFTATGSYGSTPGHQDVVVWTSADGSAWRARRARRQGPDRAGHPGHHRPRRGRQHADRRRLHRLPASEQPVFWQAPVR